MASKSNTVQSPFVSKAEVAEILGVPETSVTHVDCQHNGKTLTLKQLPGLYSRADAETIRAGRDQRELEKKEKQEAAKEPAAEVVRHESSSGISAVEQALKDAVAAGETS